MADFMGQVQTDPNQDMKVSIKDSIMKITQKNYFVVLSTWNSHLNIIR